MDFPIRCRNALNVCGISVAIAGIGPTDTVDRNVQNFAILSPISIIFLFVKNESSYLYMCHFIAIAFVVF